MELRSKEEWKEAMIATALYLPEIVWQFEAGLKALGATVLKKYVYRDKSGEVDPACLIQAQNNKFEFRLGNALREFLSIDREEKPLRFDHRLKDPAQAREKLTRIIVGRLEIARAFAECNTPEELKKRLEEMAKHFEKVRFWSIDEPQKEGDAKWE
jgi:hypothetical protein